MPDIEWRIKFETAFIEYHLFRINDWLLFSEGFAVGKRCDGLEC